MKISRDSWHYKLAELITERYEDVPDNLCGYFWRVVAGISAVALMVILTFAVLFIALGAFFVTSEPALTIGSMILWIIFGLTVLSGVREVRRKSDSIWHKDIIPDWEISIPESSFINVCGTYLASIKDKVCPTIEFK